MISADRDTGTRLVGMLNDADYVAFVAAGLDEGMRILAAQPLALVLLDERSSASSPGVSSAVAALRAGTDVPVVLLTARSLTPEAVQAAGVQAYLPLPVQPDRVRSLVARLLG